MPGPDQSWTPPAFDDLVSAPDVAARFGVSKRTVRKLLAAEAAQRAEDELLRLREIEKRQNARGIVLKRGRKKK